MQTVSNAPHSIYKLFIRANGFHLVSQVANMDIQGVVLADILCIPNTLKQIRL